MKCRFSGVVYTHWRQFWRQIHPSGLINTTLHRLGCGRLPSTNGEILCRPFGSQR